MRDSVIQSNSEQCRRISIPILSLFIISLTTALILSRQSSEQSKTENDTSAFAGPANPCNSWSRILSDDGIRSILIESDAVSDSNGDWYFSDVTALPTPNTTQYGGFRLRKLSSGGIDVAKAPLFAQAQTVSVTNAKRLYVMLALHEPSSTIVVLQSGQIGPNNPTTPISTLALHSSSDGFCSWAQNFTQPDMVSYACARSDEAPSSMINFVPSSAITSKTVFSNPVTSSCVSWVFLLGSTTGSSQGLTPQISGYLLNFPCTNLVKMTNKYQSISPFSSLSSTLTSESSSSFTSSSIYSSSQMSSTSTSNEEVPSNVYTKESIKDKLEKENSILESETRLSSSDSSSSSSIDDSSISSFGTSGSLSFGWTTGELSLPCSKQTEVPCATWDSSYGVALTSTALFESTDESIFFASFPTYKLDPWPNASSIMDADARLFSEILAVDVTGQSGYKGERWKLSTDLFILDTPVLLTAVISNIVVSDSGELFFAAVRNATSEGDLGGWERVLLSVNGKSGEVIWIYPSKGDLLDPSPRIKSNDELHMMTISLTQSSLIFCGLRPRNGTINIVGLGAVDASDGALVSLFLL
jgi:hypothetical protein